MNLIVFDRQKQFDNVKNNAQKNCELSMCLSMLLFYLNLNSINILIQGLSIGGKVGLKFGMWSHVKYCQAWV